MPNQYLTNQPRTHYLSRPEGKIAYDTQGSGPLVLLVPGMGDLRSGYRFLTPALVTAGYTVVTMDLRGHGESDTSFSTYNSVATAVIVGNSMAAGSAAIVAAEHPDLVNGLVLVGPFVRQPANSAIGLLLFRLMMARPWAATIWKMYMPSLYAGTKPVDFDEYQQTVVSSLKRPGYTRTFSQTTRTDHLHAGESLAKVTAPTLVVMGEKDPDFKDPKGEAEWIGTTLRGSVVMVPDSGHYPQSQQPTITSDAIVNFLSTVTSIA
jgi:pimeloyl-ACP methyl ester carboxylesterase